jgi:mannose-6-phosphate isomerase
VYQTNAKYFEMSKVELVSSVVHRSVSNSVEILIAIKGLATITENENTLFLEKGQSILIKPSTAYTIQTNSKVEMYKARVPK